MSKPLVEIRDLSFAFGRTSVFRSVSLSVEEGDYVAVIGPNGAGKTTLLKHINRLLSPSGGALQVAGRPVASYPRRELARLIGYVPQAEGRRWPFSVREFVLMGRYPYLSPFTPISRSDRAVADEMLALTETTTFADRGMEALSGGERQRVLIAAALAQQARLLLLDEPATFLDPHHQAHVLRVLRRVNREQGVTIVSVTHDINTAALNSRSIVALRAGEVVFRGSPESVMDNEVLERVYGMSFHFTTHPVTGQRVVVPEAAA